MLPCTSTEMDGVLMTASTPWWRKFDQDPKIRCGEPKSWIDGRMVALEWRCVDGELAHPAAVSDFRTA